MLLCALSCAAGSPLPAPEQVDLAEARRELSRAIELNPTLELRFEGCGPWSNGVGLDQVAAAPELQLEAARQARVENRDYEAAEKYFQMSVRYPDAPQTVAGLMESADLLLDLGYPSQAAFCMDQVVRRAPTGTLQEYGVRPDLAARVGGAVNPGRRIDLAMTLSALEATVGLTLLEADRLGYSGQTPGWWPITYFFDPEDYNPFYNHQASLFRQYTALDLSRQFSKTYWIPGQNNLRLFITDAFDARYYAEVHLNTMLHYDPLSYNVLSGFFHRGRLRLQEEDYSRALEDLGRIQVNYAMAERNPNYPRDALEISVFANMYSAWGRLLKVPLPWKDINHDHQARTNLVGAVQTMKKASLLQWMPVIDALDLQLQDRLATRFERMATFYDRNDASSAAELMREQLRINAPRTALAASTLELSPWHAHDRQGQTTPAAVSGH